MSLEQDSSGIPLYPQVGVREPKVNTIIDGDNQYGAQNTYKNLYVNLMSFSNIYDIILYEYDWRKDPYDTANELDAYINNNCGRVIFVAHSMGGLVSSYYLAKGINQRNRVIKHISLGTPYLGSEQIPYIMMTGNALGFKENLVVSQPITQIIWNLRSIYALLPMEEYFRSYLDYGVTSNPNSYYTYLGSINGYINTINELDSRCLNWNSSLYNQVLSHQSMLFTSTGQHITSLVDSYYIIGDGETTAQKTCMLSLMYVDDVFSLATLTNETDDGDGTVTIHSATIGGNITANKTFYTYGLEHQDLGGGDDSPSSEQNSLLNFIKVIINNQVQSLSDSTLANYNMYRTRQ